MKQHVAWLSSEAAAIYLGFVDAEGTPTMNAFYIWKHRYQPRAYRLGGRLRFRQVDLDRMVEAVPVRASSLRRGA